MTQKEKAEHLIDQYSNWTLTMEDAAACAYINVLEIIDVWENQQPRRFEEWLDIVNYWKGVKDIIAKHLHQNKK